MQLLPHACPLCDAPLPRVIPARRFPFPPCLCLSAPGRAVSLHVALISLSLALSQYNKEWEEAYEREKIT